MRERLLLVDLSNQVYKATSSHQGLTSGDVFTGGLFGFIVGLASAIKELRITRVVVAMDAPPYRRSLAYPDYKKLRKKKEKTEQDELMLMAFQQSMKLVKEFCAVASIPTWRLDGFEFDDLCAHAVRKYGRRFDQIIGWTNDSDLFQLLDCRNFYIYKGKKQGGLYGRAEFDAEYPGVKPEQIPLLLAMTGTHNDIAGIDRVGPKSAIKALKEPGYMRTLREAHGGIIDRNLPLIKLPHPDFPFDEDLPPPGRGYRSRELYKFCSRYDIDVTKFITDALEAVQA